ncbi:MAG: hypothetical protein ACLFNS_02230 [Desulfobacterales bacterium]
MIALLNYFLQKYHRGGINSFIATFRLGFAVLLIFLSIIAGCEQVVSEDARERFENRDAPFSVTVFPIHIIAGSELEHDAALARRLSEFLQSKQLAEPKVSEAPIDRPAYYGVSETKRIRLAVRHFQRAIDQVDLTTDYALMAEIVSNPDKTRVLGVYLFLADRFGRIASARMASSHHSEFQKIQPKNPADGFRVLTEMIREGWLSPPS